MAITLTDIKKMIDSYADKINVPVHLRPTYGNWKECHPNIEVDKNGQLRYEIYERGKQIKNEFALDEDDLCFRIFEGITFTMAHFFQLDKIEQDQRKFLFAKQEELLGQLNEKWKDRQHVEHQSILKFRPFDDNANLRVEYFKKLRNSGMSYEDAIKQADKEFPPMTKDI
ncbi:MAG: Imm63 family immunity protein [Bacteroidales bacterium]|jgi:hypothetical protein